MIACYMAKLHWIHYVVPSTPYYNSACLSVLGNYRSQFLLDRIGRCLKSFLSTDSTFCHEFASQFGLEFFYAKNTKNYCEYRVAHAIVYLNEAATVLSTPAKRGR